MTDEQKRDIVLIIVTILFVSYALGFGGDNEEEGASTPSAQNPIVIP